MATNILQKSKKANLHIVDFMKIWYAYDKDRNGYLEAGELENFLKDLLASKSIHQSLDEYKQHIMSKYDENHDGKLELKELAKIIIPEENFLQQFMDTGVTGDEFDKVFEHYDLNKDGVIKGAELVAFLRDLKKTQDEEPITAELEKEYKTFILDACDKDHDGSINKKELRFLLIGS